MLKYVFGIREKIFGEHKKKSIVTATNFLFLQQVSNYPPENKHSEKL